jgi:hypothetical protein
VGNGKSEVNDEEFAERGRCAALAIETLDEAIRHGFADVARLRQDPDLALLRPHPQLARLLAAAETRAAQK